MLRPVFDPDQSLAVVGALTSMITAGGREASPQQGAVVDGLSRLIFRVAGDESLPTASPAAVSAALLAPDQQEFVAELLVLVALMDPTPDPRCVASAQSFCQALDQHPENLELLHGVVRRKIGHSRHHLFQRFLADALRTGSLKGDAQQLRRMVQEGHDHPDVAAPYLALEHLPSGTFGRSFFDFYRNRGFHFPGEKGALPLAYGFEVHDAAHLLSGYNTDPTGEINVLAFQAGASSRLPWLLVAVNLVTFNSGLAYGPTHLLHYRPHVGNLDAEQWPVALDRGLSVTVDLSGDFDIHAHWERPLSDVRREVGTNPDAPDVTIPI